MRLIEKETGKAFFMDWDAAQAGIASGAYEIHPDEQNAKRGPDGVATQSPAPGVEPKVEGSQTSTANGLITNLTPVGAVGAFAPQKEFEHDASRTPHADADRAEKEANEKLATTATGPTMRVVVDQEAQEAESKARAAREEAVRRATEQAKADDAAKASKRSQGSHSA